MRHARLAVILLLAFVLSTAPVLMPPRAPGVGATVATAAQDPSAVEAALGLDRPTRRLIQQGCGTKTSTRASRTGCSGGGPVARFARGRRPVECWRPGIWTASRPNYSARPAGRRCRVPTNVPRGRCRVAVSPGRGGDRDAAARGDRTWTGASSCPRLDRSVATGYGNIDAPTPARCETWNRREFFETATVEEVAACLDVGADVAARDDDGRAPLHCGRPSTARILQPYKRSSPLVAMWRHLTVTGSRFILPLPLGV